jgi:hypothetical protein
MAELRTAHLMTLTLYVAGSRPPEGPIYDIFEVL